AHKRLRGLPVSPVVADYYLDRDALLACLRGSYAVDADRRLSILGGLYAVHVHDFLRSADADVTELERRTEGYASLGLRWEPGWFVVPWDGPRALWPGLFAGYAALGEGAGSRAR